MIKQKFLRLNSSFFWMILSFAIWIFAFRGFLASKLAIVDDAVPYQDHTRFFIENIAKGVLPLWDPFWFQGVSNDFFLRRLGIINPLYYGILFFEAFGIPYKLAYIWTMAGNYLGGTVAFYLLAMRVFNHRLIAYGGFLILLFSALGTRLFDSYMMLVAVPFIWFFYFLVAFTQTPRINFFLGICLSFMILASTYIPFYFIFFFGIFLVIFTLFYFKSIPEILSKYAQFFRSNKLLVVISGLIVLFSFVPLLEFYHYSSKGQIVLPGRHGTSEASEILTVPSWTYKWGAMEDIYYSSYFTDLRSYKFAIIYIPFFVCILLGLGLFCRNTVRTAFIFTLGIVSLLSILPFGLPFFPFFYKYIFFLKYFRNLHFFLWFVLIPLFILFALENWSLFEKLREGKAIKKKFLLLYVLAVHLLAVLFVWYKGTPLITTYLMLILSLIFWVIVVWKDFKNDFWKFLILTAVVVIQPLEVYSYLSLRALQAPKDYGYRFSFQKLDLQEYLEIPSKENLPIKKSAIYYANKNYDALYENIDMYSFLKYNQSKFLLVDHLVVIDPKKVNFVILGKQFLNNENRAFVFADPSANIKKQSNDPSDRLQAVQITQEDDRFKILSFNANTVKIFIDVPYEKFLIYNDSYDSHWQAFVNGKKTPIYQTNVAFKGIWLPAGKSIVEFKYGFWWQYAMNIFLMVSSVVILMGIIWSSRDLIFCKVKDQ